MSTRRVALKVLAATTTPLATMILKLSGRKVALAATTTPLATLTRRKTLRRTLAATTATLATLRRLMGLTLEATTEPVAELSAVKTRRITMAVILNSAAGVAPAAGGAARAVILVSGRLARRISDTIYERLE